MRKDFCTMRNRLRAPEWAYVFETIPEHGDSLSRKFFTFSTSEA